jgi:hypothetical protein
MPLPLAIFSSLFLQGLEHTYPLCYDFAACFQLLPEDTQQIKLRIWTENSFHCRDYRPDHVFHGASFFCLIVEVERLYEHAF